jgi:serine protease Do
VSELPPEGRKALGVDYGLVVEDVAPSGPAARSPLQRGDVIVAVGQEKFSSVEEFTKLLEKHKKGDNIALLVRRGEGALYVPLEVGTG